MDLPVPPLSPRLSQEDLDFLLVPSKEPCPQSQRQPLNSIQHCHQLKRARLAHLGISRPRPNGDLELSCGHVDEAGVFQLFFELRTVKSHGRADFVYGFFLIASPFDDVGICSQGPVIGAGVNVKFLAFDPAARSAVSVDTISKASGKEPSIGALEALAIT